MSQRGVLSGFGLGGAQAGKVGNFSLDMLVAFAAKVGRPVRIEVR